MIVRHFGSFKFAARAIKPHFLTTSVFFCNRSIAILGIQLVIRFLCKLPSCNIQAVQQEIIMLLSSWKIPTL